MSPKSRLKMDFKLLFFVMFALLTGCAKLNLMQSDEERVKQRASERWDALTKGRLETAYQYLTPEYREIYSFKHYRRSVAGGVGLWQQAEVTGLECNEDKCVVSLTIYVKIRPGRGFDPYDSSGALKENWVRDLESGEWFFYPKSKNF